MLKYSKYLHINNKSNQINNYIEDVDYIDTNINQSTKLLFMDRNAKYFYKLIQLYIKKITNPLKHIYFISTKQDHFCKKLKLLYNHSICEINGNNINYCMEYVIETVKSNKETNYNNNYIFIINLDENICLKKSKWLQKLFTFEKKYNINVMLYSNNIPLTSNIIRDNLDMIIFSNFVIDKDPLITGFNKLQFLNNEYLNNFMQTVEIRIYLKLLTSTQYLNVIYDKNNKRKYDKHYVININDYNDDDFLLEKEFLDKIILEI